MTAPTRVVAACNTCEVIGPGATGRAPALRLMGELGRPKRSAAEARADWARFIDDHAAHDVRLIPADYDPDLPLPTWMPRPEHGPPVTGRRSDQVVACPDCRGMWRPGAYDRAAAAAGAAVTVGQVGGHHAETIDATFGTAGRVPLVAFKTVDQGADWFWFCTGCRNVFGSAADKALVRAELGGDDLTGALWPLQRQGLDRNGPERTGRRG